ncbi:U-box domain-containing protein 21 [Platanthera guangdongensis]|uniref:U-box domain-containing protein n=1 Tax=Platanthera guangdongensis TaxID=2320717 RepID=A0ABR2LD96_9ASPA
MWSSPLPLPSPPMHFSPLPLPSPSMPHSPLPSPSMPLSPESGGGYKIMDATNTMTPRSARLTTAEVSSILSQLASASSRSEHARCRKSAARIRALAEESDRNRRRLAASGAAGVLAASFHEIAATGDGSLDVLSEILSALVLVFPVDDVDVFSDIGSPKSLDAIASILQSGCSSARLNATLVLKQIVSSNKDLARAAASIDGLIEALLSRIGDPISPRGKRASLLAAFHLVGSSQESTTARFIRTGVVSMVLESLMDSESEKRVSEAALAALDRLCSFELGRENAYGNALTVPVLVKNMFGVSDLATELSVSSLWKLCKNSVPEKEAAAGEVGCVVEALQVGAFMKLLMLLQVECRESVKERATELLRFFNNYGKGLGCIDSKDFRGLHRPV